MSNPTQMDRVRAARALLVDAKHPGIKDEQAELDAFMAIFHPDHERIVLEDPDMSKLTDDQVAWWLDGTNAVRFSTVNLTLAALRGEVQMWRTLIKGVIDRLPNARGHEPSQSCQVCAIIAELREAVDS